MIKCDECEKQFNPQLKIKRQDNIEITFFKCPGCNKEYITLVTDPKLRKLLQKAQNTFAKAQKTKKTKDVTAWQQVREEAAVYAKEANLKGLI